MTTHTLSLPRTPMDVTPTDLIALNAYSDGWKRDGISGQSRDARGREEGRDDGARGWFGRRRHAGSGRDAPTWYSRPSGEKMVMWRS